MPKEGDPGLAGRPVQLGSRLRISGVRSHQPGLDGEDEPVRRAYRPRMLGVDSAKAKLKRADGIGQCGRAGTPVGQPQFLDLEQQGVRLGEHLPAVGVSGFCGDAGVDHGTHGGPG